MARNTTPAPAVPDAPAGWFLSEYPSVGALVVPLGNTEQDVADALARGWRPLTVTKANTRTGRATARGTSGEARPVVHSGRGGGGWRQGGRWVWFATPRHPLVAPAADEPTCEAVLLADDEPAPAPAPTPAPRTASRPGLPGWLTDANREAARRDRTRQTDQQARAARAAADERDAAKATQDAAEEAAFAAYLAGQRPETRPAWLYEQPARSDEPRLAAQTADDSHEGVGARPAPDVFARAQAAAARWLREHEAGCVRCACNPWSRCPRGEGLARRAWDAQQAADGAAASATR